MKEIFYTTSKQTVLLKTILTIHCFLLFLSVNAQPKSAMSFEGDDDGDGVARRVDLPNILTPSYTKEAWIYAPMNNTAANSNNIISGTATAFWFPQNQGYKLSAGHSFPFNQVQDPVALLANTWYHVAVTYDAGTTTMNLYKNGILVSSNASVPNHSETSLQIGAFINQNYMKGLIDEVRIWNIALSVSDIRDGMTSSIAPTHPLYTNLVAYYKADENAGVIVGDSKGTNNGNFVNGSGWSVSGAAIGTASVHDYVNATKTASITYSGTGETFTATSTAGSPDGIHVYRVDVVPDNTTGITGLGGNNKYFGVFQVGGTSPTFTAVYDYGTNFSANEPTMRLFRRNDNSSATWTDAGAVQNMVANTLTATTQANGEFILGSAGNPLPVNLLRFNVGIDRSKVQLNWTTSQESNNAGFVIQRSTNRNTWLDLGFVNGKNNEFDYNYEFFDLTPVNGLNYYRLKQVDLDGKTTFSDIKFIKYIGKVGLVISPNPSHRELTIRIGNSGLLDTEVNIVDIQGKLVQKFSMNQYQKTISIENLVSGMYVLQFADGSTLQFIKN